MPKGTTVKPIILFKHEAPRHRVDFAPDFTLLDFDLAAGTPDDDARKNARILVTSGFIGVTREEIAALPALGLICTIGTGYEKVDQDAARERGIRITHAAGMNAPSVADHAFALLLSIVRNIPVYDASARAGKWREDLPQRPMANGKKIGIIGMGGIGQGIARRAEGFDMEVSYMARAAKADLPWRYFDNLRDMAGHVDFLISAVPGGPATHHMIDRAVLEALGPAGFLVNVGRGSVVHTDDLIAALRDGVIAGAGLDVFEDEPAVPEALCTMTNVVLTPHVGGAAPEVQILGVKLMRRNIEAFLAGKPLVSPIPELSEA
jgi:lactate dehydrogenase-like 2-hydroxyacid dehydrogenase